MASEPNQVPVSGSERAVVPGAKAIGAPDPNERIEVTVRVRPRPGSGELPSADEIGALPPPQRQYLSREEFAADYGADPDDIAKVEAFADAAGLEVVETSAARRSVVLAGTVAALSAAFGVDLQRYESSQGAYRGRTGPLHVPSDLAPIVEGVFGLDDRRQARPYIMWPGPEAAVVHAVAPHVSYTPPQVAQLYNFPANADGQGQCIGIIEFGGGFAAADLTAYFGGLGLPVPQVSAVGIDGAQNSPGTDHDSDGEVLLDIEVAGAIAPGARIVVYFAPFTERGWVDAVTTAVHDAQNKPSVLSISWGWTEGAIAEADVWTPQAIQAVNQAFQAAAAMGVTVVCASGDDGAADEQTDGQVHVDFPASSPYVLGCGGTSLRSAGAAITSEVVWNNGPRGPGGGATGGGVSDVFDLPSWQANAHVPPSVNPDHRVGRGVPDVAGDADENTGYTIRVDGNEVQGMGGTSAVAPLWAGLVARINQVLGQPVGYFTPLLYRQLATGPGVFHDITQGSNDTTGHLGGYPAGPGWDACTGWGSPDGMKLLHALISPPPAG